MEPGRGDDRIHHGVTNLDDDLHGHGHRWNDHVLEEWVRHRNGESVADGRGEFGNDLHGGHDNVDGNNRCFEPELRVESGWRNDSIDYGIADRDDDLSRYGDGWDHDLFEVRVRDSKSESAADGDGEFGDDLPWRVGNAHGDNQCEQPELFMEPGRRDHGIDHGFTVGDDGLYRNGN